MGNLRKISFKNKELTIEQIDANELKKSAKKHNGSFKDNFGVYFILTTGENNLTFEQIINSRDHINKYFIGQAGTVKNTLTDPNTNEKIFSGAELCDLIVMPDYRRQGYGTLLTELRLEWLAKQGYNDAFFPCNNTRKPVQELFTKLSDEGRISFEKIYEIQNPKTSQSVYKVSNFQI